MTTRLTAILVLALLALPAAAAETQSPPPERGKPQTERIESPRERMMMMRRHRAMDHGTHYGMGWEQRQGMGPMMMGPGRRGEAPAPQERKGE